MNDTGAIHDFSPRCAKTTLAFQSVLSLDPSNIQVSCMFTAVPVRNSSSTNTTGSADAGTVEEGTTRLPVKQEQDLIEALDSADGRCAATANSIFAHHSCVQVPATRAPTPWPGVTGDACAGCMLRPIQGSDRPG